MWRTIRKSDIKPGLVVMITRMVGKTPYCVGTVMDIDKGLAGFILTIARPFASTSFQVDDRDNTIPLINCEIIQESFYYKGKGSDLQVFEESGAPKLMNDCLI